MSIQEGGHILAVGAYFEDSNATVLGDDQTDDPAADSSSVYFY